MAKIITQSLPKTFFLGGFLVFAFFSFVSAFSANAQEPSATLYVSPAGGTFGVGETFTVSIYVNTGGNFVNAVEANLTFPPDKLQVVSPSVGKSFIEIWVGQPQYSNIDGTLFFRGAIPSPGINVSQGLISTVTFRVKAVGSALLKFSDSSKVLLNDGRGTNALADTTGGVYILTLPAPAGPFVTSSSHPDQGKWYARSDIILQWSEGAPTNGYSYVLNREPITMPDNISEGGAENIEYANVADGVHYFHIKALRGGVWGGATHYALQVDTTPPAAFEIEVEPGARTSNLRPIIYFATTDVYSGISHYETKIVALSLNPARAEGSEKGGQDFFVETTSPYISSLEKGKYQLLVRAYDNAGNFQEISKRLIVGSFFAALVGFLAEGWIWIFLILILFLLVSILYYHHWHDLHREIDNQRRLGALNHAPITRKFRGLEDLRRKYANKGAILVAMLLVSLGLFAIPAQAASEEPGVAAPLVTTYPGTVTNDELFYVGGKHNVVGSQIIIFVQNADTGERFEFQTETDKRGDWFYAHDSFLSPGAYQLWAQAGVEGVESPPSAQETFRVAPAVLRFGASRISYDTIYFIISLILLIAICVILVFAYFHRRELRRKHRLLLKEISEAEESIRRGFALLKRDIEEELRLVHQTKLSRELASEETAREKTLLEDLARVEEEIGREVWDIKLQS